MHLYSYKMTHDSGFAPNPFYKTLTLATCKPGIRRTKKNRGNGDSDWVAGFASKALANHPNKRLTLDSNALIWIGRVEKSLTFEDYFNAPDFKDKKPDSNGDAIQKVGDNIYKPLVSAPCKSIDFHQLRSEHDESHKTNDLGGERVLIFKEFWYFGAEGKPLSSDIAIPTGPTCYGYKTTFDNEQILRVLINKHSGGKIGRIGYPCLMDDQFNETSQKMSCGPCR